KLPLLKQGDCETWRLRIEQYFQIQDHALWDIIENGNSFNHIARTTTNVDGTSTSTILGPVATEEKAQKKNDVKAKSSQNMAFGSTPSSTNEINTANVQVSTANSTVSTDSTLDSTANLSDATWQLALLSMRAKRYYQRTGKKITINGSDTAGYDKSKVECFNYHKMRHFARECTDISKITRKQSKNEQARTREPEEYKAEARKAKPQSKSAKENQ
ncbi:ribonuclease H-like domain-containing protein, partial [Tanacetum coccineum]